MLTRGQRFALIELPVAGRPKLPVRGRRLIRARFTLIEWLACRGVAFKRSQSKMRFTLIELLVVVAIISILASMLLPVLTRAREMGRLAVCQSNQKQMVMGLTLYLDDHDSHQPVWGCYATKNNGLRKYLYTTRIAPYLGFAAIDSVPFVDGASGPFGKYCDLAENNGPIRRGPLFCPSESNYNCSYSDGWVSAITNYGTIGFAWDSRWVNDGSFLDNGHGLGNPDFNASKINEICSKRISRFDDFSQLGVFGHMSAHKATYLGLGWAVGDWSANSFTWHTPDDGPNHVGSLPFGFMDNHVETLSRTQLADESHYGPNAEYPMWGRWCRWGDATMKAMFAETYDRPADVPAAMWDVPDAAVDANKY